MGLFSLISNTVEGVAQAAASTVKIAAGVLVAPLDGGETAEQGADDLVNGVRKIGAPTPPTQTGEKP